MLFLVVLVLMLGTICACIAFALEISDLKSKTPLTDTENSFATDTQQQDLSDMVKEINNSLLQFQMDTSFDYQGLKGLTQQLNTTLNLQFQAVIMSMTLNALKFSASIRQLNTSHFALNNNFQQLNSFIGSVSASFQQLNSSLNGQYSALNDNFQQLNSSISCLYANLPAASCAALPPSSPLVTTASLPPMALLCMYTVT